MCLKQINQHFFIVLLITSLLASSSNLVFVHLQCYVNYSGTPFVCLTIIVHYVTAV